MSSLEQRLQLILRDTGLTYAERLGRDDRRVDLTEISDSGGYLGKGPLPHGDDRLARGFDQRNGRFRD